MMKKAPFSVKINNGIISWGRLALPSVILESSEERTAASAGNATSLGP
jgi:hypothetical protein